MPHRTPSPPTSETEFDITATLFGDDDDGSETGVGISRKTGESAVLNAGEILDFAEGGDSGDDGDAAFIAAHQAASNRKSSNVKGRSVKKGGGFQAMGRNIFRCNTIGEEMLTI